MALKRILTKDEHGKLAADIQKEYKADEKGENFILDLTDYEDPAALKRAKDHEKTARKAAEDALKAKETELAALIEERDGMLKGTVKKDDLDKLETSYKKKLADKEAELTKQIGGLTSNLTTILVDNEAIRIASEISNAPQVILPHIKARLKADFVDGKAVTKVLDKDGNPSASTLEDLRKEFVDNKDFAPIITGSKGSGGGDHKGGGNGGAGSGKVDFNAPAGAVAKSLSSRLRTPGQ